MNGLLIELTVLSFILLLSLIGLVFKFIKTKKQNTEKYDRLLSQKKSSEVLLGQVTEKIAPFLKEFPYDPRKSTFLGMPIDYIVFGDKEITFVEIKSGNARLSKKQSDIRNLVKHKKVAWHEINIK